MNVSNIHAIAREALAAAPIGGGSAYIQGGGVELAVAARHPYETTRAAPAVRGGDIEEPCLRQGGRGSPAKPFWPTLPSDAQVQKIWPNPEGGWVVVAMQAFDDGRFHTTLTLLDEQGTAVRLGCSPKENGRVLITVPVAIAPDAVYAATRDTIASTWAIDHIAR